MKYLLSFLFQLVSKLPLPILHIIAKCLSFFAFYVQKKDVMRIRENLQIAGLPCDNGAVRAVLCETAKGGLELPIAFFREPKEIEKLFVAVHGWEYVQTALDNGKGLLFITPHLGSYDLAGRYISQRLPFDLTAMYKPPKIKMFDEIMQAGRVRGKGKTAPTNLAGVKQVMKALRAGEATIVLPDHVPAPEEGGDGVWVKFFGKPAFTMTLAGKLANVKDVVPLFFCGERLADGRGFVLHIEPVKGELTGDKAHDAQVMNDNVEYWIRRFPNQYLFAYNRYKKPAGASDMPSEI